MNISRISGACVILFFSIIFISCSEGLRDQDGNVLKTIRIGDQLWMSENLNVSHFRNGEVIPEAKSNEEWIKMGMEKEPAWCFGYNNPDNKNKYGRLYNWYAVNDPRGIAPKGWHVSSDDEWTELIRFFGNEVFAAMQLREKSMFFPPAGSRTYEGFFFGSGSHGFWWSSSESSNEDAWNRTLNYVQCNIYNQTNPKISGFSVRCLRN
ncbi:MAG: fibrobacter succinogenes major paralogous domain-containing protein [Bacteroidota bacterium]